MNNELCTSSGDYWIKPSAKLNKQPSKAAVLLVDMREKIQKIYPICTNRLWQIA